MAEGQADAEIEVTPEMIEAGTKALWKTSLADFPNPADALDVRDVLEAALRVRSGRQ